jgi:glycosyltransferase involved in cell wall biosynthesis
MRIGIDARLYGRYSRGIGRYAQELIRHLEKLDASHEYVVFMNAEGASELNFKNKKWKKVVVDIPWYSFSEQFKLPKAIKKENIDVMHFPHYNVPLFFNKPLIVTIHDLLLHRHPTSNASTRNKIFFYIKYLAYRIVFRHSIRRAGKIIAVSHFTKKEILSFYPSCSNTIEVIYEGVNLPASKMHTSVVQNQLLYVGALYPHKMIKEAIITIYPLLVSHNATLVLVGREDYFHKKLKLFLEKLSYSRVVFKGEVSDSELESLYDESKALLYPSVYEGFGLPPLEALVSGCPVIAFESEAVKEVSGKYIKLYKKDVELKTLIDEVLNYEKNVVTDSVFRELNQKYSWQDMAKNTESLYNIVHGDSGKS